MRAHLGAVLRDFAASQTQAAQRRSAGADAEAAHLARLSVRRRLARAGTAIGVVVVVLVLAGGVVYGVTRPEPEPPATPAPVSPTVEPTAAPTLAPIPDFDPDPDDGVTVHPLLPDAQPLEPGMLADAGPGWSLVAYQGTCDHPCSQPPSPRVHYLVSPTGQLYEVPVPSQSWLLQEWLPGTSRAVFDLSDWNPWQGDYFVADLETGEVLGRTVARYAAPSLGPADDLYVCAEGDDFPELLRTRLDGEVLGRAPGGYRGGFQWNDNREYFLQGRSGSAVVVAVPSLEVIEVEASIPPHHPALHQISHCSALGWSGPTEVLFECAGRERDWDWKDGFIWRVSLSGTARAVGWLDGHWSGRGEVWRVGDRLITEVWDSQSEHDLFVEITADGDFVPLDLDADAVSISGVAGDRVLAVVHSGSGSYSLRVLDPFTGASEALLTPVSGSLGRIAVVIPGAAR